MGAVDIKLYHLLIIYALLALPALLSLLFKLGLIKTMLISVVRMTVQLSLIGIYLEFIFKYDNLLLNIGWVLMMITIAAVTVIRNANLKLLPLLPAVLPGFIVVTFSLVFTFIIVAVRPTPFYNAAYLIPLSGMLLGNCLKGNIISLERFYFSIRKNRTEFIGFLMMGASLREAVSPYLKEAVKPAIFPTLSSMATLGLVSLPGMMTGQILGGSTPLVAIKYQIAIMIAILTAVMLTTILNISLSLRFTFNSYNILKEEIFKR